MARVPTGGTLWILSAVSVAWIVAGGRRVLPLLLLPGLVVSTLAARAWDGTTDAGSGMVDGVVRLVGDPKPLPGGGWRVEVMIDGRHLDAEFGAAHIEVEELLAGEGVTITGRIDATPRRWQRVRHVGGTLTVLSAGPVQPAGPISGLANLLRRTLSKGAEPLGEEASALLGGLVVGDDRAQGDRTSDDFRAAGLGHLLAVSGQNVAFVLAAAGPLIYRLRFRYRLPLAILLLGFFALVTRFEPSVLRATVMAGGSALAAARGRTVGGMRLLSASVLVLLLLDPLLIHRAAFQLSVAASAGILLAARPLAGVLPGPKMLKEAAGVTLAAQAAVAPLLLARFGPVPVAALPANLLAAPVAGPLMIWGITGGLAAGVLGPPMDWVLHMPSAVGLWWIAAVAGWAGRWSLGLLGGPAGLSVTAAVGAIAVLAARGALTAARRLLLALFAALTVVAALTAMDHPGVGVMDGVRILDQRGSVVAVDRAPSARRLLEELRARGVSYPELIVFREPLAPGLADALRDRYGDVLLVGPPGSVGAEIPDDETVLEVAGEAWLLDLGSGILSLRRLGSGSTR